MTSSLNSTQLTASDITFGIEIECKIPRAKYNSWNITASWGRPPQCPELPEGWRVKTDASLRHLNGHECVEIVSPVLKGSDGVAQVKEVYAKLNEWGVQIGTDCGLHIHAGIDGSNERGLCNLIRLSAQHEKALFASTGSKRREQTYFCKPITEQYRKYAKRNNCNYQVMDEDKFSAVNFKNIFGTKGTVEFRLFAPTMNVTKVLGHLACVLGIVEKAYTANCTHAYQESNQPTTGKDAVEKLMKRLNWTRNGGFGVIDKTVVNAIKKEFRRLAAKYDDAA